MESGREVERSKAAHRSQSSRKEPVMMFAFVLAIVGIVVLKTLEHVAARG